LDLACGRGQIIISLDENLSAEARANIDYWAYDIDQTYAKETRKCAEGLGFGSFDIKVGDLSDFHRILPASVVFDFITLTNTVHEVDTGQLAGLFVNCIVRLSDSGMLFVYDIERITPAELGALPWSRDDVRHMMRRMLDAFGASAYRPELGRWKHRNSDGWHVLLERQNLHVSQADLSAMVDGAIQNTHDEILKVLRRRLVECRNYLDNLTQYGARTAEEQQDKERLLFEFWAISRALERAT
jgi:ubiquinone/menaquinone biosynthesis C-methylase UbiE